MPAPILPEMLVEDLVRVYPSAAAFLRRHGIVCLQCGEAVWGTLDEAITAGKQDVPATIAALEAHLAAAGEL
jgi:hypothetical protein